MSNAVTDTVMQMWRQGRKVKHSPSGWHSGNAVCCGDKRQRGGLRLTEQDGWVWHCFNCQFKTGWAPGSLIGPKVKRLLTLLGASDQQLAQLSMESLRLKENIPLLTEQSKVIGHFESCELPKDAKPLAEYLTDVDNDNLFDVCDYILKRRLAIGQYFWSPEMPRRFIIPFEWRGNLVGWTARSIDRIKSTRYLSSVSPGYVYGLNEQDPEWTQLLVCEGVLDADCIGGCAIMGSNINETQMELLTRTGKRIIWVPDQDEAGLKLAERVLDLGWDISMPNWENCKDINDAVILWGRTAVLLSIMQNVFSNKLAAQLRIKQLRGKLRTND